MAESNTLAVDIDALETLAKAATPGPWRDAWDEIATKSEHPDDDEIAIESMAPDLAGDDNAVKRIVVGAIYYDGKNLAIHREDAAFIAACRDAVPALIARVRAAEAATGRCSCASYAADIAGEACPIHGYEEAVARARRAEARIAELGARVTELEADIPRAVDAAANEGRAHGRSRERVAVICWLLDRAEQYGNSSRYRAFVDACGADRGEDQTMSDKHTHAEAQSVGMAESILRAKLAGAEVRNGELHARLAAEEVAAAVMREALAEIAREGKLSAYVEGVIERALSSDTGKAGR